MKVYKYVPLELATTEDMARELDSRNKRYVVIVDHEFYYSERLTPYQLSQLATLLDEEAARLEGDLGPE